MKKELSDDELDTYARQIALDEIDYDGQVKLRNARASIIGLGGLGSLIALKLVAMGIGYLRMVDRDIVSRSDLHRQYLYDVDSVGQPKVEVALRKLSRLNPDVELDPVPESLNSTNATEMIDGVDIVLDGLDRPEPRYLINRVCHKLRIPYIFAGVIESYGNVFTIVPGQTMCLECFMSGIKDDDLPKCAIVGVHPSVLGIITAIQVFEAVRLMTGQQPVLLNKLLYVSLKGLKFHLLELSAREDCPVCGASPSGLPEPIEDKFFEETCARDGRRNFIISPKERTEINLEQLRRILHEKRFHEKAVSIFGVTFEQFEHITFSILKSGVMIAQASPIIQSDPKEDVFEVYKSILIDGLGLPWSILPDKDKK